MIKKEVEKILERTRKSLIRDLEEAKKRMAEFYQRNPDFPATDAMCRELEKKATEERISLDEAWKRMGKKEE